MSIDEENERGKGSVAIKKARATAQRVKREKKLQEEGSTGKGEPGARKATVNSQKPISLYEDECWVNSKKGTDSTYFLLCHSSPLRGEPQHLLLILGLAVKSIRVTKRETIFKGGVSDTLESLEAWALFLIYVL